MSCKNCESSSTSYTRCNPPISTNCTFYQGDSKVCNNDSTFTICKGDSLTSIQQTFFEKICKLIGDVDLSKINVPACLKEAWDNSDPSILNYISFLLEQHCLLKESISNIVESQETLDPLVTICLACCSESNCTGTTTIKLSQALTEIVQCLCNAKAEIETLKTNLITLTESFNTYKSIVDPKLILIDSIILNQTTINSRLTCL